MQKGGWSARVFQRVQLGWLGLQVRSVVLLTAVAAVSLALRGVLLRPSSPGSGASSSACEAPPADVAASKNFLSQSREDVALYEKFYRDPPKCGGTFVEIGALDGIRYSNSYFFEKALRWKSLLIEANPSNYARLKTNRPEAFTVGAAMCPEGGSVEFVGDGATGGVVDTMSESHREGWIPAGSQSVRVDCREFGPLFREHGISHVDVFVLDVEGAELVVLEVMDWSVPVDYWVVELDGTDEAKDAAVRELLSEHGYAPVVWNISDWCVAGQDCASNEVFSPSTLTR